MAKAPVSRHLVMMVAGPDSPALLEKVRAALSHKHPGASWAHAVAPQPPDSPYLK